MSAELRRQADLRLDEALGRASVRDPRDSYRERLRLLREQEPLAFEEARRYYEETLVPRVAGQDSDPVLEWFEYGRFLAESTSAGKNARIVVVDQSGRANDYTPPPPLDHLILHIPDDNRTPVLPLSTPRQLTPPQQATFDLLVLGSRRIGE